MSLNRIDHLMSLKVMRVSFVSLALFKEAERVWFVGLHLACGRITSNPSHSGPKAENKTLPIQRQSFGGVFFSSRASIYLFNRSFEFSDSAAMYLAPFKSSFRTQLQTLQLDSETTSCRFSLISLRPQSRFLPSNIAETVVIRSFMMAPLRKDNFQGSFCLHCSNDSGRRLLLPCP